MRRRAGDAATVLSAGFPGDPETPLRCPALDAATGRCDPYAWRPLARRTLGPPVRPGGEDLPPCAFCFGPFPAEDAERYRAAPDPEGREDSLLSALEARTGLGGETLIAFALLGGRPPGLR